MLRRGMDIGLLSHFTDLRAVSYTGLGVTD